MSEIVEHGNIQGGQNGEMYFGVEGIASEKVYVPTQAQMDPRDSIILEYGNQETETEIRKRFPQTNGQLQLSPTIPGNRNHIPADKLPMCHKGIRQWMPLSEYVDYPLFGEAAEEEVYTANLLNLPDMRAFKLNCNGQELMPDLEKVMRRYDYSEYVWRTLVTYKNGDNVVEASFTDFADYSQPDRAVRHVTLVPRQKCNLDIKTGIDTKDRDEYLVEQEGRQYAVNNIVSFNAKTQDGIRYAIAQGTDLQDSKGTVYHASKKYAAKTQNQPWQSFRVDTDFSNPLTLTIVSEIQYDDAGPKTRQELEKTVVSFVKDDPKYEIIREDHTEALANQIRNNYIRITNDPEWNAAMNYSKVELISDSGLYGLYSRIAPRILSDIGTAYCGRFFWDDIFSMKTLTREQQRAICVDMNATVAIGRQKAAEWSERDMNLGIVTQPYSGSVPIWEEWTKVVGRKPEGGPEKIPLDNGTFAEIRTINESVHIAADYIYANIKYAKDTGDYSVIWREGGINALLEYARFLASFAREQNGRYSYIGVSGPDEWHEHVNNNAYTVLMSKWALLQIEKLKAAEPQLFEIACKEIGLSYAELEKMQKVREGLQVDIDPQTLLISPFEGWDKLASSQNLYALFPDLVGVRNLDVEVRKRLKQIPGWEKFDPVTMSNPVKHFQVIKQDDLMLALLLLQEDIVELLPPETRPFIMSIFDTDTAIATAIFKANYNELAPITINLSSLSPGTVAESAIYAGRKSDEAKEIAKECIFMDHTKAVINGVHGANNGNAAGIMNRFIGVTAIEEGGVAIAPLMPTQWNTDSMQEYHGALLRVITEQTTKGETITVEPRYLPGDGEVPIRLRDLPFTITPSTERVIYSRIFATNEATIAEEKVFLAATHLAPR